MYENTKCEYCGELFAKNDDVVVCPDCGAPYHRACWQAHGKCAHAHEHAQGYQYGKGFAPKTELEFADEDFVEKVKQEIFGNVPDQERKYCENCGAGLVEGNEYCVLCGHKQGAPIRSGKRKNAGKNPLGGLEPDALIDGVKVSDLVLLVRSNSDKLLPKLQRVSERKVKVGWSWLAFFFGYLYLFFRKLYKYGLIAVVAMVLLFNVFNVALGDPIAKATQTVTAAYNSVSSESATSEEAYYDAMEEATQSLMKDGTIARMYLVLGGSLLISNLACALLFHYLYLRHCKDTVNRMKKSAEILGDMSASEYRINLLARGGISLFGLVLGYFSYFLLGQIVAYLIELFSQLFAG